MNLRNRLSLLLATLAVTPAGCLCAAEMNELSSSSNVGIVSFRKCVEQSQQGKAEQAAFEALKNQMGAVLQKTEKELDDLSKKLQDAEFMDGLSPDAEQDLKLKFEGLNQEMGRYQNQYYQILNQANMKVVQVLSTQVATASSKVANDQGLMVVLNEDACFFYNSSLDVTQKVISEMDKTYKPSDNALPANGDAQNTPNASNATPNTPSSMPKSSGK
ncbi:MAG: OmpH family outer membrane protein [Parachlamydiales bacterium]|nr:OmpH family outer membrane protein [Parachlamydiales bacterium]